MSHLPTPGNHICTSCLKTKPLEEFYLDNRKKSGVASWCKACSLSKARKAISDKKKEKKKKRA